MMKTLVAVLALGAFAPAAFAKGGTPQNHHCKMKDGTMDMGKTKKQCHAAGGEWAKDAPSGGGEAGGGGAAPPPATGGTGSAPAPTPAPTK